MNGKILSLFFTLMLISIFLSGCFEENNTNEQKSTDTEYEGVFVNGTITCSGCKSEIDFQAATQNDVSDKYGHPVGSYLDKSVYNGSIVDGSGTFDLVVGLKERIQIRLIFGEFSLELQNIYFNGEAGSALAEITENDALRTEGSNYERNIEILIENHSISGHVYNDTNYDTTYDAQEDEPLSGRTVFLYRIYEWLYDRAELDVENYFIVETNEDGYYEFTSLIPSLYRMIVENQDGFLVYLDDLILNDNNLTHDIINARPANLQGIVYYDINENNEYDIGEELSDVNVELIYDNQIGISKTIAATITGADGRYSFESIVPGQIDGRDFNRYLIQAEKLPDYTSVIEVYPAENDTTYLNISISKIIDI